MFLAVVAVAAVLLLPGYCTLRAIGLRRAWSVALAPAISVALLSALGEVYRIVGIDATPMSLLAIPSILLLVVVAARRFPTDTLSLPHISGWQVLLYVFVGFAVGYIVFVRSMGQTDSYFRGVDFVQHINETRAFIDSKTFTSIAQTYYLADPELETVVVHGFYPSGYHVVAALAAMMSGQELTVVINACNLCSCALIWPLALLAFFGLVFEDRPYAVWLGSLVTVCASIFPWGLLVFGPLFPNLMSFAMVPAAAAFFVFALRDGIAAKERVCSLVCMVVALVGMFFTQPNATFTAAVFLVPYVCSRLLSLRGRTSKRLKRPFPTAAAVGLCVLFVAFCVAAWIFCLYLPFLYGTVTFVWEYQEPALQAFLNALGFSNVYSFNWVACQFVQGVLALIGAGYAIYLRKYRWLCWSALLGQALCFVCLTNATPIKNYVGGFWYTDPWRMSCMAVMMTLPLVLLGLMCLYALVKRLVEAVREKRAAKAAAGEAASDGAAAAGEAAKAARRPGRLAAKLHALSSDSIAGAIVAVFFIVAGYWGCVGPIAAPADGGYIVPFNESGWTCLRRTIFDQYRLEAPYTHGESDFVEEVLEIVGDDAVFNDPYDGSVIAYGSDDLRTYYRYVREYTTYKEDEDSAYLREHIGEVAEDPETQRLLEERDIHYLMQLSHDDYHSSFFMGAERHGTFAEVENIDENTPGFELIYSEDGMNLYRITALDEDAA